MKHKILTLLFIMAFFTNIASAATYQADAKTRRLPAGTKLQLQLLDSVNSISGYEGYPFTAMLLNDQKSDNSVILPAGSIIRGSISRLKQTKCFSRGAMIYLNFDHVVTPNGRQLPLELGLCDRADITKDGGIQGSKGYGEALKKNWAKTIEITQNSTNYGIDMGEDAFTGAQYITTPICAIGGALGGSAYLVGNSIIDMFRKGDDVILNKGTTINVILSAPVDVPVY